MKLVGKKISDIDSKYHTVNGERLKGCFFDLGDDNGKIVFFKDDTPVYSAGVWHTTQHHWMEKQNETITSLYSDLEEVA